MPTALRFELLIALLMAAACTACARKDPSQLHASAVAPARDLTEPSPYPPGRWRLAPAGELEEAIIWVSHILIRHADSDQHVMGTVFDWRSDAPRPERGRGEALALANEIAAKLAAHPESFEELARRHSEDSTSASLGGSVGGTRTSDFRFEPEVLDALAALEPGQTSRVVETRHGFQIFRLRPVPEAGTVSGEHIVIGHEAASWLKNVGAPPAQRTHAQALALAREIHASLRRHPESFPDSVRQRSDHPDRAVGGDIGAWSVREVTPHPRAVQALRGLPVGGISPPFESHYGVEIVRRTPNRERPLYAMAAISLAFALDDPESKRETHELARRTLELLKKAPTRFDEFRRKYCCAQSVRWFEGRDEPGLSGVIAGLEFDEIASAPVEQYGAWLIPKRVDPSGLASSPETKFLVPAPERPELEWILQRLPPPLLAQEIAQVAEAYPGLAASELPRQLLREILSVANPASESASAQASVSRFSANVRQLFAENDAARYLTIFEDRVGNMLMRAGEVR